MARPGSAGCTPERVRPARSISWPRLAQEAYGDEAWVVTLDQMEAEGLVWRGR